LKTCLVTGGTGFIGSALTRSLLEQGYNVRILDDNSRGNFRRLSDVINSLDIREGDIRNADLVSKSLLGVDVVVHLAYINGTINFYERPREVLDVAIVGMQNVLAAMKVIMFQNFIWHLALKFINTQTFSRRPKMYLWLFPTHSIHVTHMALEK
jgi:nucleoside-diphosphate-sugar epimerase